MECCGAQCKPGVSHIPLFSAELQPTLWLTGLLSMRPSLQQRLQILPPSLGLTASEAASMAHTLGLQLPQGMPPTLSILPGESEGRFQGLFSLHPYSEGWVGENTLKSQAGIHDLMFLWHRKMNAVRNTAGLTSSLQVCFPPKLHTYRCLSFMRERTVPRGHMFPQEAKVRVRGQEDVMLTTGRRGQSLWSEGITGQAGIDDLSGVILIQMTPLSPLPSQS